MKRIRLRERLFLGISILWLAGLVPSLGALQLVNDDLFKLVGSAAQLPTLHPVAIIDMDSGRNACSYDRSLGRSASGCVAEIVAAASRTGASGVVLDLSLPAVLSNRADEISAEDEKLRSALLRADNPIFLIREWQAPLSPRAAPRPLPTIFDDIANPHIRFSTFVLTGDAGKSGRYLDAVEGDDGRILKSVPAAIVGFSRFHVAHAGVIRLRRDSIPITEDPRPVPLGHGPTNMLIEASPQDVLDGVGKAELRGRFWVVGNSGSGADRHEGEFGARPGVQLLGQAISERSLLNGARVMPGWTWPALVLALAWSTAILWLYIEEKNRSPLLGLFLGFAVSGFLTWLFPAVAPIVMPVRSWEAIDIAVEAGLLTLLMIISFHLAVLAVHIFNRHKDKGASL